MITPTTSTYSSTDLSYKFLSLFTAFVIVLLVYTLVKMMSSRFINKHPNTATRTQQSRRDIIDERFHSKRTRQRNRNEQIGDIIRKHGSRNVALALRHIADELEKQKQALYSQYVQNEVTSS